MLIKGEYDSTRAIMAKIYPFAKPEEVDLKIKVLQASVRRSVEISQTTTIFQRFRSMVGNPVNRRALSMCFELTQRTQLTPEQSLGAACKLSNNFVVLTP